MQAGARSWTTDAPVETAISSLRAFTATPAFTGPEQFLGVEIRSDLYSLGVTLWEMLVARVPFLGSPREVMYQHQHAALPLELLEGNQIFCLRKWRIN